MKLTLAPIDPKASKKASLFIKFGALLIVCGLALFVITYYPVIAEELRFAASKQDAGAEVVLAPTQNNTAPEPTNAASTIKSGVDTAGAVVAVKKPSAKSGAKQIVPVNSQFSIVVPKIGANRPVVANVDPYNRSEYHDKLREGVAHAKGSALPGQNGNMFIFSHSSVSFYEAPRYNTIFYLLDKLVKGDKIVVAFEGKLYTYAVTEKKVVKPTEVSYLTAKGDRSTLTLMTCTPVGTSLNRLLVNAELVTESI